MFKNSILRPADYECDDLDCENAACEEDSFVDSACSSEGFEEGNDLFWRVDSKTICDKQCNIDDCCINNGPSVLNDNCSSSPASVSSSSSNDSGLALDCFKLSTANGGPPSDSISPCKENIRFPSDKKPYLSESLCRWSECAEHISSSSKLLDHLQVGVTVCLIQY